jgi:hypothetical protein
MLKTSKAEKIASFLLAESVVGNIDGSRLKTRTYSVNKSRAMTDPDSLCKALGMTGRYSDDKDSANVLECLRDAQNGNSSMQECYEKPKLRGKRVIVGLRSTDDSNWKARFIELALIAAERSGRLRLRKRIVLDRDSNEIFIDCES